MSGTSLKRCQKLWKWLWQPMLHSTFLAAAARPLSRKFTQHHSTHGADTITGNNQGQNWVLKSYTLVQQSLLRQLQCLAGTCWAKRSSTFAFGLDCTLCATNESVHRRMSAKITAICVSAQPCSVQHLLLKSLKVRGRCKQGKLQLSNFNVEPMLCRLALISALWWCLWLWSYTTWNACDIHGYELQHRSICFVRKLHPTIFILLAQQAIRELQG